MIRTSSSRNLCQQGESESDGRNESGGPLDLAVPQIPVENCFSPHAQRCWQSRPRRQRQAAWARPEGEGQRQQRLRRGEAVQISASEVSGSRKPTGQGFHTAQGTHFEPQQQPRAQQQQRRDSNAQLEVQTADYMYIVPLPLPVICRQVRPGHVLSQGQKACAWCKHSILGGQPIHLGFDRTFCTVQCRECFRLLCKQAKQRRKASICHRRKIMSDSNSTISVRSHGEVGRLHQPFA